MRVEFFDSVSMKSYKDSGVDSILTLILDENSNLFNSKLFLSNSKYKINQYIQSAESIDELIHIHQSLMEKEEVFFIDSMYDYYFKNHSDSTVNYLDLNAFNSFFNSKSIHRTYQNNVYNEIPVDYQSYKNSLLDLEEKLISLQENYRTGNYKNTFITEILIYLLGNEDMVDGFLSNYIDLIDKEMNYAVENMNILCLKDIQLIKYESRYADSQFDTDKLSNHSRNHLMEEDLFKIT